MSEAQVLVRTRAYNHGYIPSHTLPHSCPNISTILEEWWWWGGVSEGCVRWVSMEVEAGECAGGGAWSALQGVAGCSGRCGARACPDRT